MFLLEIHEWFDEIRLNANFRMRLGSFLYPSMILRSEGRHRVRLAG
jgi:hypothetical protein